MKEVNFVHPPPEDKKMPVGVAARAVAKGLLKKAAKKRSKAKVSPKSKVKANVGPKQHKATPSGIRAKATSAVRKESVKTGKKTFSDSPKQLRAIAKRTKNHLKREQTARRKAGAPYAIKPKYKKGK